jgi:hypothetical protein
MPNTTSLLGKHKITSEWYTPDYVWQWIEYIFDSNRAVIFDPCPIGGTGGLELDWTKHKLIYVNPPSPAMLWAIRTISYKTRKDMCLLYLSFSESVIWQVPELLTVPTILIRKRIKFVSNNPNQKSNPSNYNALHLINGNREVYNRFKRIANLTGTLIQSNII